MIPLLALASVSVAQARHGFYQTPSRFAYPDQAPILWKDQADSGMTTATISGNGANHFGQPNAIAFARMMSMMLDSGVIDPDFPILALSMGARPCYDAQLQAQRPWPELIIGNVDEPNPTRKAEVEAEHKEAHRMGFRSGTAIAGYNVEPLAEFLDVWIVSARTWMPNLKELAKEHDADLWAYWAQESTGDPERCRYFFGLWTWARQIECSMVWAYTHESGTKVQPNGTRVSEKSDKFSYAIPTAFGKPLHTPGYEGLIDGIKDCRALEAAERNGGPECQKWLAKLRKSVPLRVPNPGKPLPDFNLDKIRKQALKWSQARVDRSASKKPAPAASKKESK
jgi:hypothetical protein